MSDALRRLAESESRLVHVHLHERRIEEGVSEEQALREVAALEDAVVPLLDGLVRRIHHEFLLYAAVEDAYLHLVDSERASGRATVETTIVFIDLASFTSLTETEGDAAAVALVTHL